MPLTEYELDWIAEVSKKPVDQAALQKAAKLQQQREDFLKNGVTGVVEKKRQQIEAAQQVMLQTATETTGIEKLWRKARGKSATKITEMPWRAKDEDLGSGWQTRMDIEVDTKEDVSEDNLEIPEEQLEALNDALATILETQNHMLLQFDDEGNRLFSDDDIRRELWTPMVRSGLIPENMVPDKFSEEAKAFKGATEIYGDKIKDYSKKSTGKEDLLKGLRIAKEVVTLTSTIVTSSISMANAPTIAHNTEMLRTGKGTDEIGRAHV